LHRLSTSFILGYHGCDRHVDERLLAGEAFQASTDDYDWLGPGVYFWEANPRRGFEFATEAALRRGSSIQGRHWSRDRPRKLSGFDHQCRSSFRCEAHKDLIGTLSQTGCTPPVNSTDTRRRSHCAVILRVHAIVQKSASTPIDTVKAAFIEGPPLCPTAGFHEKTHTQMPCVIPLAFEAFSAFPPISFAERRRRLQAPGATCRRPD